MPLPEYGRNIQLLVDHLLTIDNKEERTNAAHAVISLMAQQNPQLRNQIDFHKRLWDQLHIMSDYQLDVDSDFQKPEKPKEAVLKEKRLEYPKKQVKFRFYGKNVELMINRCIEMPEGEEKEKYVGIITAYMRMSYRLWNDDKVSDELILKHLRQLSDHKLSAVSIPDFPMPIEKTPIKEYKKHKPKNHSKKKQNRNNY